MKSSQQPRKRFKAVQDWSDYVHKQQDSGRQITGASLFELRKACYSDIEKRRKNPLLVYAANFTGGVPSGIPNSIDFFDIDGFTDLISTVKDSVAVDILLHSPGGRPDVTERLVDLLRGRFQEVNFLIPHSAYSAATMLALSGDSIILHPSASLGPIDPQINGVPARSIKRGFEKAKKRIAKEGLEILPAYVPLIEKYSLELLELCEDSEKLAKELVSTWLKEYMFKGEKNSSKKIKEAVKYFTDYDRHLMHSRPLSLKKLTEFGLKIELADEELQNLLWEAYVLLTGFFASAPLAKLYENSRGTSWGKLYSAEVQPQQ